MSSYNETLRSLFSRHVVKMGIFNGKALASRMGNVHDQYKTIHVAGTNGKGSVSNKIAAVLQYKGFSVGLFTSPHVSSFRERIRVNGQLITEADVTRLFNDIVKTADSADTQLDLTFFEICTQMAFSHFAEKKVDYAVIETGLGGRLDATNLLEKPAAVCVTSIGWDHMAILGNTLETIAMEKFGILKAGVPAVLGPQAVPFAHLVEEKCKQDNIPVLLVPKGPNSESFDKENSKTARMVCESVLKIEMADNYWDKALSYAPPFRCQVLSPSYAASAHATVSRRLIPGKVGESIKEPHSTVLDVGHNETALARLCGTLLNIYPDQTFRVCVALSKERQSGILDVFQTNLKDRLTVWTSGRVVPT
eukprot:GHVU01147498.1.p1 GENE.GHVU01147498.1~~GHVU01147498.1.p1  ORF type:complete len:364 (+),score=28.30 GHVU01147498.1:45-1136(+)